MAYVRSLYELKRFTDRNPHSEERTDTRATSERITEEPSDTHSITDSSRNTTPNPTAKQLMSAERAATETPSPLRVEKAVTSTDLTRTTHDSTTLLALGSVDGFPADDHSPDADAVALVRRNSSRIH